MVERSRPTLNPGSAAEKWRAELAEWRIDDEILAAAPESPYRLRPEHFHAVADDPDRLPYALARAPLEDGAVVLDVGCGAGAGSLPLAPPASTLIGVDQSADMLEAFAGAVRAKGLTAMTYQGLWPHVADAVPAADVVVCHHVFYNVPDLPAFATALTAKARRRVVVELTAVHPWVPIGPLWQHFHGQPRPSGPTAQLAAQVLREAGIDVNVDTAPDRPRASITPEMQVESTRRRLGLPASRDAEVAQVLAAHPIERRDDVVVLWWDCDDPGART